MLQLGNQNFNFNGSMNIQIKQSTWKVLSRNHFYKQCNKSKVIVYLRIVWLEKIQTRHQLSYITISLGPKARLQPLNLRMNKKELEIKIVNCYIFFSEQTHISTTCGIKNLIPSLRSKIKSKGAKNQGKKCCNFFIKLFQSL